MLLERPLRRSHVQRDCCQADIDDSLASVPGHRHLSEVNKSSSLGLAFSSCPHRVLHSQSSQSLSARDSCSALQRSFRCPRLSVLVPLFLPMILLKGLLDWETSSIYLPFLVLAQTADDNEKIERRILTMLYESTDGDQWFNKTNWLDPNMGICSWFGVTCDSLESSISTVDEGVIKIELPNNNLVRTLPTQLYGMPYLQVLNLRQNPLTEASFEGFQRAEKELRHTAPLQHLDLSHCLLTDASGLRHAPAATLTQIQLASNQIVSAFDDIGFSALTNLRTLDLTFNKIRGMIPTMIGSFQSLRE
jgi:Leucine Rich repeat